MAFCKFCGKELDKKGNCTCEESKAGSTPEREHIKADELTDGKAKKILIIVCIVAALLVIGVVAGLIIGAANAYKKPIKDVVKGINRSDTERIVSAMYTDDAASELKVRVKDKNISWDDYVDQNDKSIDTIMKSRNIKKIKVDILAKEKLSGSNLTQIEDYFHNNYEEEVKKAYRVEVEFTVKYKDGEETKSGWLTVAKIKDSGWRFTTEGSDYFDFINDLIQLL